MKRLAFSVTLALSLALSSTALAWGFSGSFSGKAVQTTIDINGDTIMGRDFSLRVFQNMRFTQLSGVVDSGVVAWPGQSTYCEDPAATELIVYGTVIFETWDADAIFAEVDSSVPVCYVEGQPEYIEIVITGGFGEYEGSSGTGTVVLNDRILMKVEEGPLTGFPLLVYSTGTFDLQLE